MALTPTPNVRNLTKFEFNDSYDRPCSLQESSSAMVPRIWLGRDKARILVESSGLEYVMPPGFFIDSRMHLSRQQVKDLLPRLIKFAETGEL